MTIALLTLARIAYLRWLSPYELIADEAQYWDWSRRLAMSYYSKGPGIAWLIALSTRLFGISEWSIRLPAALALAATSAAVARLAVILASDERSAERGAVIAVLLVNLVPAYQLASIVMTIDAPYIACWALATLFAWRIYRGECDRQPSWLAWLGCASAIGIGFLFKYTMLMLPVGLLTLAVLEWDRLQWGTLARGLAAAAVTALAMLPVIWWNIDHQAAGLGHLLGYLQVPGGDQPVRAHGGYDPLWTASFIGAQLGIIGPIIGCLLLVLRVHRLDRPEAVRFALCCMLPTLLAFLIVTLRAPAEGNWPIAAYVSLVPLAACTIASSPRRDLRRWWHLAVAYGTLSLLLIHAPLMTARLPLVGRYVPVHRFRGFAASSRALVEPVRRFAHGSGDGAPLIVATSHNAAGLLAFYLPGHPSVASAGRFLGDRPSAYDYFSDVSLTSERTQGRRAVLIGGTADRWREALVMDDLVMLSPLGPEYATSRLRGPRDRAAQSAGILK